MYSTYNSDVFKKLKPVLIRGHRKLDGQTGFPKITKRHFFQDNQVSF